MTAASPAMPAAVLDEARPIAPPQKFSNPDVTLSGEPRARVPLSALETLWINTGTLCNITCANCYIESSPSNDRLAYITRAEARAYLDEIATLKLATREIGFTGGEPFLNPDMLGMLGDALGRGFAVLVLTNAMQPMQRPRIKKGLLALREAHGDRLTLRVSLDHHNETLHEAERGPQTWKKALDGIDWLAANGFNLAIAGRTCWGETEAEAREGYAGLIAAQGWPIDATDPAGLMLLPEMDANAAVPEITTACWQHPRQEALRHDVRQEPDGGEASRRGGSDRAALHADPLRRAASTWGPPSRNRWLPMAACSPRAASSCATSTAPSSASSAAAAVREGVSARAGLTGGGRCRIDRAGPRLPPARPCTSSTASIISR